MIGWEGRGSDHGMPFVVGKICAKFVTAGRVGACQQDAVSCLQLKVACHCDCGKCSVPAQHGGWVDHTCLRQC